jgi:hypothetical protein
MKRAFGYMLAVVAMAVQVAAGALPVGAVCLSCAEGPARGGGTAPEAVVAAVEDDGGCCCGGGEGALEAGGRHGVETAACGCGLDGGRACASCVRVSGGERPAVRESSPRAEEAKAVEGTASAPAWVSAAVRPWTDGGRRAAAPPRANESPPHLANLRTTCLIL